MDARTLLVALVCLAAGTGLGWFLGQGAGGDATPVTDIDVPPSDADEPADDAPALDSASAVGAALRKDLDEARSTIGDLTKERDGLREELEKLRADAEAGRLAGGETETSTLRYGGGRFQKTLEAIDWEEAGQALSRMSPLLGEVISAQLEGKPMPPSVGDIQKYNGALVKMALKAEQDGVPGSGTNGSFTHVAIVANLVYATLKHADLPLSESQEAKLATLADELIAEDEKRLKSYGDSTLALRKILEETAIKDRFYAGVDAMLTEEQRNALHPESIRGRTSYDLFSSGLVWAQRVAPQRFRDKEQLTQALVGQVMMRYAVAEERRAVVEETVAEWVAALPASLVDEAPDAMEAKTGAFRVSRVRDAAAAQLQGFERLLQRLPADDPAAAKIRAEARVAMPLLTKPE